MHVESHLNTSTAPVHPYCLSLDSIANVLYSLQTNKCLSKQTIAEPKPSIQYEANTNELDQIFLYLQRCCFVLKDFNALRNYFVNAKL